jgi:hypothetical protein
MPWINGCGALDHCTSQLLHLTDDVPIRTDHRYFDPDLASAHMGEAYQQRIERFLEGA